MSKQSKVTLTLEGRHDDVMEYVNMALGDGLVTSLNVAEVGGTNGSRQRAPLVLSAGDRIKVRTSAAQYDANKDDTGRVVSVKNSGHGRLVTVKWDGDGESEIAASLLVKVKK